MTRVTAPLDSLDPLAPEATPSWAHRALRGLPGSQGRATMVDQDPRGHQDPQEPLWSGTMGMDAPSVSRDHQDPPEHRDYLGTRQG